MHACYSLIKRRLLTDFLSELVKGSSLRLSLAASLVLRGDPVFYALLRFKRQRKKRLRHSPQSPVASWEEEYKLSGGQQSYTKFCLWRDSVP